MKTAFCLLTRTINIEYVKFLEEIKNKSDIDVYILCDDNSVLIPESDISILRYDNKFMKTTNYTHSTYVTTSNDILAWDKAIYHFCEIDTSYDYVFFIEDDIFIPTIESISYINNKYQDDLLCKGNIGFKEDDNEDISKWHWKHLKGTLQLPWYASMVCGIRVSKRLLQEIKKVINKVQNIPFIEGLFNTIAVHNGFSINTIDEFKQICYSKTDADYIKYIDYLQKGNWIHPIKNIELHSIIREILFN